MVDFLMLGFSCGWMEGRKMGGSGEEQEEWQTQSPERRGRNLLADNAGGEWFGR